MKDLIEAFTIFSKYSDDEYPTNCDHDELSVSVDPSDVSTPDRMRLRELGFEPSVAEQRFYSFRFGSN